MLAIFGLSVNAQWIQTNGPYGGQINCLAVKGSEIFAGTDENGIFATSDNGSSWISLNTEPIVSNTTSLLTYGSNILAGGQGYTAYSTDNGISWTSVLYTSGTSFAVIGSNIFTGCYRMSISSDSGITWTQMNNNVPPNYPGVLAACGTNLYAGIDYLFCTGGGMYKSIDSATSWTVINSGLQNSWIQALAVKDTNIFAGTTGGIFRLSNNDTIWTPVSHGLTNYDIRSFIVSGSNIFAGSNGGGVFLSMDNGANWVAVNTGLPASTAVYALAISGNYLYAGTLNAGVWKRSLTDILMSNCSALFTLEADTTTPHHYFVTNNAFGTPPLTYTWSWGDGTTDNVAYPSHTYSTAGYYNICLTITDSIGCTSTYCDSTYLQKSTNSMLTIDVIPQGTTGINENELLNQIKTYPNPVINYLTIETPPQSTIKISSIQGQLIKTLATSGSKINVDVSSLPCGVYLVEVRTEKGVAVKKFIKE